MAQEPQAYSAQVEEVPLRRHAEINRQRILQAAGTLFALRGVDASHDEVARAAGVGVATVYRRFPTKQSLLSVLLGDQIRAVVTIAETALLDDDPLRGLVGFLEQALDIQAGNRALREMMLGRLHQPSEVADLAQQELTPLLEELVERVRRAGQLRAGATAEDVSLIPIMISAVIERLDEAAPQVHRRLLAIMLSGLLDPHAAAVAREPLPGSALSAEQVAVMLTARN